MINDFWDYSFDLKLFLIDIFCVKKLPKIVSKHFMTKYFLYLRFLSKESSYENVWTVDEACPEIFK